MFDFDELEVATPVGADGLRPGEQASAAAPAGEEGESASVAESPEDLPRLRAEKERAVQEEDFKLAAALKRRIDGLVERLARPPASVAAEEAGDAARSLERCHTLLSAGDASSAGTLAAELLQEQPSEEQRYKLQKVQLLAFLHPEFRPPDTAGVDADEVLRKAKLLADELPQSVSAALLLGRALCLQSRRQEADAIWKKAAAREGPGGEAQQLLRSLAAVDAHRKEGNAAFKDTKWEAAEAAYTRALEADRLWVDRGLAAAVLGNRSAARRKLALFKEALADADQSLQMCPTYVKARFRRALVLMQFEQYAEALQDLQAVQRAEPDTAGLSEWLLRAEHWSRSRQRNHYATLGAPMDSTQEEIKRAHKRMALKWHPDKASGECSKEECGERFKAIQEAFEFLSSQDARQREVYDFGRSMNRTAPVQAAAPAQQAQRGGAADYAAKREPMPAKLVKMGFGTIKKGDGNVTCMVCGEYCETYWEKKHHIVVTDHPGFFDTKGKK